jgi:hypothetical protein
MVFLRHLAIFRTIVSLDRHERGPAAMQRLPVVRATLGAVHGLASEVCARRRVAGCDFASRRGGNVQRLAARKATARSPLLQNRAVMPRLLGDDACD